MLNITVNVDGLEQKIKTTAILAEDLDEVLHKFGGYLRKRAIERINAQNYSPLAASTLKNRAAKGLHKLELKLASDVRKAVKRDRAPKGLIAKTMVALGARAMESGAPAGKGTQNRAAVLAEFRRIHRMGDSGLSAKSSGKQLTLKQAASLSARTGRAITKAMNKPILGQLNRSPITDVTNGILTLTAATQTHFSEIHNEGDEKNPKRVMILLEEADLTILKSMLVEHCMSGWDDA